MLLHAIDIVYITEELFTKCKFEEIVLSVDMISEEAVNFFWGVFVNNSNAGWRMCGICLEMEVNDFIL